jgi:hypothetical protein
MHLGHAGTVERPSRLGKTLAEACLPTEHCVLLASEGLRLEQWFERDRSHLLRSRFRLFNSHGPGNWRFLGSLGPAGSLLARGFGPNCFGLHNRLRRLNGLNGLNGLKGRRRFLLPHCFWRCLPSEDVG